MADDKPKRRWPEHERKLPRYHVDDLTCEKDSLGRKHYKTPEGRPVCGRRKKRKNAEFEGEACCAPPTESGPCRVHGAGGGRPWTSGGRHSRVLRRWKPAFERAFQDAAILDGRPDLAMMDVLVERLTRRVEAGDCPQWRDELEELFDELENAIQRNKQRQVAGLLKRLGDHIRSGASTDQLAEDLTRVIERRANQANRINALTLRRDERITVKEMGLLFSRWIEIMQRSLDEPTFNSLVPQLQRAASSMNVEPVGAPQQMVIEADEDDAA